MSGAVTFFGDIGSPMWQRAWAEAPAAALAARDWGHAGRHPRETA
jgi:hypothetical protein